MSFWDSLKESEKRECVNKNLTHKEYPGKWYYPCGPVRDKWTTEVYPTIEKIINEAGNQAYIYKSSSKHPGFSVRLFMVFNNPSWKPARPTIVVSCRERKFAKRVVDRLEKWPTLKKPVLGFDFLIRGDDTKLVADHSEATSPVTQQMGLSLCGARVVISPSQTNPSWTQATLGGVIIIDGRFYGLTAAHALCPPQGCAEAEDSDAVSSDGNASASSNGDDNYDIPTEAQGLTPSDGARFDAEITQMESQSIYLDGETSPPIINRDDKVVQKPENLKAENLIGTVKATGSQHELEGGHVNVENDWALFEISPSRYQTPNTVRTPSGEIIQSVHVAPAEPNGAVLVAAGVSGVFQSECSGLLSGITLPNSTRMLDAWTITESCRPGDCGAWVLDRQNGDVFGMIVATSRSSQESYCLPMSKIFDSIHAIRPNSSTISFPGTSRQAAITDPAHESYSQLNDPPNSEEHPIVSHLTEEPSQSNSQISSPEIRDHQPGSKPTNSLERSSIDATDQSPSKAPEEADVLPAIVDVNALKEQVVVEEHPPPARLRLTKVSTQEIPISALDSLGVPWRKVDSDLTHVRVDRGFMRALQRAKAQQQPAKIESSPSPPRSRPSSPLPRMEISEAPRRTPEPMKELRSETAIDGRPKATSEPKLRAEQRSSVRVDDAESDSTDYTGKIEKRTELHVVGDEIVEVTRGPVLNKTLIPATLVEDRILNALSFSFYIQDGMYHILEALDEDHIEQVVEFSKVYRAEQGMPADKQSSRTIFQRSSNPTQSPRQVTFERYDLLFEGEIREFFSEANFPEERTRALIAASREFIQRFRENRDKLREALTFLEDATHNAAKTHNSPGKPEHVENARHRVTIEEEPTSRPSSPPPKRVASRDAFISRTPPDFPHGREKIDIRPSTQRTYRGPMAGGDNYGLPRVMKPDLISKRSAGERRGQTHEEDIIIDRSEIGLREINFAAPEATRLHGEREGQDDIQAQIYTEEADFYNRRALERAYVGEAYNGATRDWAIVDVPPSTQRVTMHGVGGAKQEISWESYNGLRRAAFIPQGTTESLSAGGNAESKVFERTSKSHTAPEPAVEEQKREQRRSKDTSRRQAYNRPPEGDRENEGVMGTAPDPDENQWNEQVREKSVRFDRPREPRSYRSSQKPFMTPVMRVKKQYVAREALDYYGLPWEQDPNDIHFILILENMSEDMQQRVFRYSQALKGRKAIKNMPEFQDEDTENIIREARAADRYRGMRQRRPVQRERDEIDFRRNDRERSSLRHFDHDRDYSPEIHYPAVPIHPRDHDRYERRRPLNDRELNLLFGNEQDHSRAVPIQRPSLSTFDIYQPQPFELERRPIERDRGPIERERDYDRHLSGPLERERVHDSYRPQPFEREHDPDLFRTRSYERERDDYEDGFTRRYEREIHPQPIVLHRNGTDIRRAERDPHPARGGVEIYRGEREPPLPREDIEIYRTEREFHHPQEDIEIDIIRTELGPTAPRGAPFARSDPRERPPALMHRDEREPETRSRESAAPPNRSRSPSPTHPVTDRKPDDGPAVEEVD